MTGPADEIRFACQPGCRKCCEVHGYVYLTQSDLENAAAYLGLSAADFEARYVVRFKHVLRFRKPKAAQCHFLESGGCAIHPVKPVQCRLYPFWPELVENRKNWREESRMCPGIGKGDLVQIGTACDTAAEMKRAYPTHY